MQAGHAYTVQEVENAVISFYTNPTNVVQANAWLVEFMQTKSAWEISIGLLQSSRQEVKFFAANTLHQKMKNDSEDLSTEFSSHLLNAILVFLNTASAGNPQILTKISLALVELGLQLTKTEGQLKAMMLDNPNFLSLQPEIALEFFLLLPQEWDRWSVTRARQDKALGELAQLLSHVVALLQSILAMSNREDLMKRSLQALSGWCKFGLTLSNLKELPIYPMVKQLTSSPVVGKEALELFESAVVNETHPPEPEQVILEVVADMAQLQPLLHNAIMSNNDSFCDGFCNLGRALMLRRPSLMASGKGETLAIANVMLELCAHKNRGISEVSMEYFDDLQTVEMVERHEFLQKQIFSSLSELLATRCALYPADCEDWDSGDTDDFNMYRRRVEDALQNCSVCLQADNLGILCSLLAKHQNNSWQVVEGILFAVSCIGGELTTLTGNAERQAVLAGVTNLLTHFIFTRSIPQHKLVIASSLKVIENYSRCLTQNPSLLSPSLEYVLPSLVNPDTCEYGARAFREVCSRGCLHLRDPALVQQLVQGIVSEMNRIPREILQDVVESLGRVIAVLEVPAIETNLDILMAPFLSRLADILDQTGSNPGFVKASVLVEAASCIHLVGATVRFLEVGEEQLSACPQRPHPVVSVISKAWEVLEAFGNRFGGDSSIAEAISCSFIRAIKQAKLRTQPAVENLFQLTTSLFRSSHSEKCLEFAQEAVEIFGGIEGASRVFGELFNQLSHVKFEIAQSKGHESNPDLTTCFFNMCHRYLIFCPEAIVSQPSFQTTLQLALVTVMMREKYPVQAVLSFFERVVNTSSPYFENFLSHWFEANGSSLVQNLVIALAETAPKEAMVRLAHLLFHLNAKFGSVHQTWLQNSLFGPSFPAKDIDEDTKKQFLSGNMNVERNPRRYQALIDDFANICRRQQTCDALVAYQMS
uniref:Exportin-1/Importin-beta-like domain-containing protein n=1 Tax=Guillardia theta TaxID=55529 RepID=A0A7S4NJI2_GUITH|mmetsp:Transcript_23172/g.75394  ORF Transcript_23172/g.75394 Transcript_23172/m.75394 type:complete len:934 (+) Transcript_23172:193-2994(+)